MIGYYSEASDSQTFPISILQHIYPSEGNFIALISDTKFQNISLTRKVKF